MYISHMAHMWSPMGLSMADARLQDVRTRVQVRAWRAQATQEHGHMQPPRLAPLPFVRHDRLQLRLPSRGAIANLKLEAQPDFGAPLSDSEIELEVCTRARTQHTCSKYYSAGQPPLPTHFPSCC